VSPPPSREQHSAAVVDGALFIFGGKTRVFEDNTTTAPYFDHLYNDMWKLPLETPVDVKLSWGSTVSTSEAVAIPQDRRLFASVNGTSYESQVGDGSSARKGMCIESLVVHVNLSHQCVNQLRISLLGPGPTTPSPNFHPSANDFEVLLFDRPVTNGTGCASGIQTFTFDDYSTLSSDTCCTQKFRGTYAPSGRLREYMGASSTAKWTLVVEDTKNDTLSGSLYAWGIDFIVSPCVKSFKWYNLSDYSSEVHVPIPRYRARALTHNSSIFIYGGRDMYDNILTDLFRYDTLSNSWTRLTPVNFNIAWETATSIGSNFVLTTWGLLRFGGLYQANAMTSFGETFVNDVYVLDPVTLRWSKLDIAFDSVPGGVPISSFSNPLDPHVPAIRYLAAATFIPSGSLSWQKQFDYRSLYTDRIPSDYINYMGAVSDTLLVFGGFNGATGRVVDGSAGGMLNDLWLLRLTNRNTAASIAKQKKYHNDSCAWRSTTAVTLSSTSCFGGTDSTCELRDILLLAWCSFNNQSIA
jgi:subtilisin-like proprotein convertase family protein